MIMARGKGEALCFLIHRLGWIVIVESFFYPRNFFKDLRDDLISMEEKKGVIIFQTHYPSKVEDVDYNFYAMILDDSPTKLESGVVEISREERGAKEKSARRFPRRVSIPPVVVPFQREKPLFFSAALFAVRVLFPPLFH